MTDVSDESCKENKNTQFVFNYLFFSENRAVYEIMWTNTVEPGRPQVTQYVSCALHAGYLRLQTGTYNVSRIVFFFYCNNDCTKAPHCYVIRTLPVLLYYMYCLELIIFFLSIWMHI